MIEARRTRSRNFVGASSCVPRCLRGYLSVCRPLVLYDVFSLFGKAERRERARAVKVMKAEIMKRLIFILSDDCKEVTKKVSEKRLMKPVDETLKSLFFSFHTTGQPDSYR